MAENRIAVVTGASRGIGRAIALRLAKDGATVVINYQKAAQAAQEVEAEIASFGGEARCYPCDVADAAACQDFVGEVLETYGRIDILVNNAGITRDNLLMRMSEQEFDEVINTNLKGTYHMIHAAIRSMIRQRSGRIINIASVVGVTGNAGQANYAASKAGIIGLTKAAAREVASRGITVNAVAPGYIETDMNRALSDSVKDSIRDQIPLGTFGTPEQVACAVAFLASEEADYITGQVLHVDGGMVM